MINRKSNVPLYIQLADLIREQIRNGEIKVGDKLPSETEMIDLYRLGRLTIRDALSILVNEGILEKHHGKGTFCRTNAVTQKFKVDVLLNLSDIYFSPYYLRSICGELESANADIILSDTKNDIDVIYTHLEKALAEGSDGVIFQPPSEISRAPQNFCELLARLENAGIPYIMIDTFFENVPASYVIMDEVQAGKIAADYFVSLGHTSLCVIGQDLRVDSVLRLKGFSQALDFEPYKINNSPELFKSIKTMLSEHKDITGIFCYHEGIAKKCYECLAELGISIPDEISVISVDDTIIASTLSPTLTSVIHPKEKLGTASAKAMMAILSKQIDWPYKKIFEPSLALRKSCREI